MDYHYFCADCGKEHPPRGFLTRCPACGGVLLIQQNLESRTDRLRRLFDFAITDMWKYEPLLPVAVPAPEMSLGEGGTPLLEAPRLAAELGLERLLIKNEAVNPSGSFKDRQVSVGVCKALEMNIETVAVASSGNVAASAAAEAARHGLECLVFAPQMAPKEKLLQAMSYGSRVSQVLTHSSAEIMDLVREACEEAGWFNLSTSGSTNPFNVEGAKTIAYELYEQTRGDLPAILFIPVGGGGLLGGVHSGFCELRELELIQDLPRLIGVQARGCAPLVRAIEEGLAPVEIMSQPWENPHSIAGGIADDILFDAHRALPAIHDSKGKAVPVSDDEILEAMRHLASLEGLFIEPSGAASVAGLLRLRREGLIDPSESICCLATGAGLKDMAAAEEIATSIRRIEPKLSNLLAAGR
jgi:threonine synthase